MDFHFWVYSSFKVNKSLIKLFLYYLYGIILILFIYKALT